MEASMIAAATAVVSAMTELMLGASSTLLEWCKEWADTISELLGLPPARGTWRWMESAEGLAERKAFESMPGVTVADLPSLMAQGIEQRAEQAAEDFSHYSQSFASIPAGYYDGPILPMADASPSVTYIGPPIVCLYCGVRAQDPRAGICGQCGGPLPISEAPRKVWSSIEVENMPPGAPTTLELSRDAAGAIVGATVRHPGTYFPDPPRYAELTRPAPMDLGEIYK